MTTNYCTKSKGEELFWQSCWPYSPILVSSIHLWQESSTSGYNGSKNEPQFKLDLGQPIGSLNRSSGTFPCFGSDGGKYGGFHLFYFLKHIQFVTMTLSIFECWLGQA